MATLLSESSQKTQKTPKTYICNILGFVLIVIMCLIFKSVCYICNSRLPVAAAGRTPAAGLCSDMSSVV